MAIQVEDSNAAFLLMAEVMVVTLTMLLSLLHQGRCHCWVWGRRQSSQDCLCRNNALDNNDNNELAQEMVGTRQQDQCHGTCHQWRQLLVWAFTCKSKRGELFWLYYAPT